jgi:hypothetical protein
LTPNQVKYDCTIYDIANMTEAMQLEQYAQQTADDLAAAKAKKR